jgi:hypothetical protein
MTEKRQTSHGYIIRILQHFATKLWNITNFVMLFQAVMKFLSRSKFLMFIYELEQSPPQVLLKLCIRITYEIYSSVLKPAIYELPKYLCTIEYFTYII